MDKAQARAGLYIHIPFCVQKCPYCDFYSLPPRGDIAQRYVGAVIREAAAARHKYAAEFDTLYIGGGTPSVLGADALAEMVTALRGVFNIDTQAEVTVELNPSDVGDEHKEFAFSRLAAAGVNRLSLGLQSASDDERRQLGRRGKATDTARAAGRAREAGIADISFDLMLGIPGQTIDTLRRCVAFCAENAATHVSAYMLKIEEGTPFAVREHSLNLPPEDEVCALYHAACNALEAAGYKQYEISNFALDGYRSRHNLKYWHTLDYLGIGPGAHSFLNGRRFFYPRDVEAFIAGAPPRDDGPGGDFAEFAMLALRLNDGLENAAVNTRFGADIPAAMRQKAVAFAANKLLIADERGIRLTRAGFLLSNTIIAALLGDEVLAAFGSAHSSAP